MLMVAHLLTLVTEVIFGTDRTNVSGAYYGQLVAVITTDVGVLDLGFAVCGPPQSRLSKPSNLTAAISNKETGGFSC